MRSPKIKKIQKIQKIQEIIEEESDIMPHSQIKEFFADFNDKNKLKGKINAISKEYFCCDMTKKYKKQDPIQFSQLADQDTIFNLEYFLEFLAYQIIFFFLLGPVLSAILYLFYNNSALSQNQHFWGFNHIFILQTFQYILILTSFLLYYNFQPINIYSVEIYLLMMHMIIYFCIKTTKFATITPNKMDFIRKNRLTRLEYTSEFFMGMCVEAKRFDIEKELQATILRKEIDIGLFGFCFITPMKKKYNDRLLDEEEMSNRDILALKTTKIGLQTEILKKAVRECDNEVYSGFNLASLLLEQNKKHIYSKKAIYVISLSFSFITAFIPNIVRIHKNGTCIGETSVENYMIISLFLGTIIFVSSNVLFLINCVFEYDQVYQYLSQLSNLLSAKKVDNYYSKKYLPTIDFFEPFTFKSWGTLHRILRNFGKKQKTRVDCQLTVFLFAVIALIICLILSVFDYLGTFSEVNFAIFLSQTIFILIILLIILKKGIAINKLYCLHITLLKNNKNILSDLLRLNEIYFQNEKFAPENEVYIQGIISLNKLCERMIEQKFFVEKPGLIGDKTNGFIKKILKNLIKISDDIIEELKYTLENEPFTVFSIPATEDVMHSVWALIASVVVAIVKKMIFK